MWTHLIRLGQHTFEVTANSAAALRMLRQQYDPNYEQKCFMVNQRYVYGVPVPAISPIAYGRASMTGRDGAEIRNFR
jgi:hypothetical protein